MERESVLGQVDALGLFDLLDVVVEAALVKDLGTSFEQEIPALIEAALGADPAASIAPDLYRALAYVSQMSPTFSLRGGTREILRGMIARGLGLR